MKVPINQRDIELRSMASIESRLPIIFDNGTEITSIETTCSCCDADIDPSHLTGSVTSFNKDLTIIEAVGYCEPCHIFTRYLMRAHSDFRITSPAKGGWKEFHSKTGIAQKIINLFSAKEKMIFRKMR